MTLKLLALAKVCSVLGNISDVSWHLSKRGSEFENRSTFSFLDKNSLHKNKACATGAGAAPGGGAVTGSQLVITDPERLVPVQITIPAQPGNPQSQARALTVQVPAHALSKEGPSAAVLQTLLTQAITSALDLPESHAAKFLQDRINSAFNLR